MTKSQPAQSFYCSVASRESGEQVFGTASVGDFWVLLEYAGLWAPHALEGSALAPEIKARLLNLPKVIPRARTLFIRRGRVGTPHINLFVVRSRERGSAIVKFELGAYADLLDVDFEALAAGSTAGGGRLSNEPLYLVCTHGRRDKCCAKFGWPLYKSLRERAGEAVWQSSHVGGDRFAANLVCFPHGLFYARVSEEAGARVVEEYGRGRIRVENYRGRACYGHHVQAAEFFVRHESGAAGVDELRYAGASRVDDAARCVRFAASDGGTVHEAVVRRRASDFRNLVTCHDVEQKAVPQYVLEAYRTLEARPGGA
jgi:hypothetical protein